MSRLQKIRAHLSGCAPCQQFVDTLASMISMLARLPKSEAPAELKQSILERVKEEEKRARQQ